MRTAEEGQGGKNKKPTGGKFKLVRFRSRCWGRKLDKHPRRGQKINRGDQSELGPKKKPEKEKGRGGERAEHPAGRTARSLGFAQRVGRGSKKVWVNPKNGGGKRPGWGGARDNQLNTTNVKPVKGLVAPDGHSNGWTISRGNGEGRSGLPIKKILRENRLKWERQLADREKLKARTSIVFEIACQEGEHGFSRRVPDQKRRTQGKREKKN